MDTVGDTTTVRTLLDQNAGWPPVERRDSLITLWRGGELTRPTAVLPLARGGVAIADRGQVLVWRGGDSATVLGRSGTGPGEFRQVDGLARWAGDTMLVWDGALLRLTWITMEGKVARTRTRSAFTGYISARHVHLRPVAGGIVLAWARGVVHVGEPPDSVVLAFSELGTEHITAVAVVPDLVWTYAGQFLGPLNTYGARPLYAVSPSGRVAVATGEDYCVVVHQHGQQRVQRICRAWRRSSAGDLQRPPAAAMAELGRRAAALEVLVAAQHLGDRKNSIDEFAFDTEDRLWVRPVDSTSTFHPTWLAQIPSLRPHVYVWDVFGTDGRLGRRVAIPSRLRPLWFDRDGVWGVIDEADGSVSIGCVPLSPSSRCVR